MNIAPDQCAKIPSQLTYSDASPYNSEYEESKNEYLQTKNEYEQSKNKYEETINKLKVEFDAIQTEYCVVTETRNNLREKLNNKQYPKNQVEKTSMNVANSTTLNQKSIPNTNSNIKSASTDEKSLINDSYFSWRDEKCPKTCPKECNSKMKAGCPIM